MVEINPTRFPWEHTTILVGLFVRMGNKIGVI